jgi:hypothetical protein
MRVSGESNLRRAACVESCEMSLMLRKKPSRLYSSGPLSAVHTSAGYACCAPSGAVPRVLADSSNEAKSFMLKCDTTNDGGAVRLIPCRVEAAVCVS